MNAQWHDAGEFEKTYRLSGPDQPGVLTSTRPVVEAGEHVWINPERLDALLEQCWSRDDVPVSPPAWDTRYHFFDGTERTVNWLLLLDALNFCFWAEKDQPRWTIEYEGETLNGYWAEAAALKRAVHDGCPLWDARYLSEMSRDDLAAIFRESPLPSAENRNPAPIPLLEDRLANAREVGRVLLDRFDGQFARAIEEAAGSAVALTLLLVDCFPSFRDTACFRGQEVRFFKRAQICVSDIFTAFGGKQWGAFGDMDRLTIFADYKLPQFLRHFGVLEYAPVLARRVDELELLPSGSEEEIEIRAATIWACELLRQKINSSGHRPVTSAEIDQQLWSLSQDTAAMRPYHRTRTIYY